MNRSEGYTIMNAALARYRNARTALDNNSGCRITKRDYALACSHYNGARALVRNEVLADDWDSILHGLMLSDNDVNVPNWDPEPPPRQPMYYTLEQEARLRQAEIGAEIQRREAEAMEEARRREDEARYDRMYEPDRDQEPL